MEFFREIIRKLLANPMSMFVYGILAKWYIMMYVGAIVVTYWVFSGLSETGVLSSAYNIVSHAVEDAKSIAKNCTRQINNPQAFWKCIQSLPEYGEPEKEEKKLLEELNSAHEKIFKKNNPEQHNPYEGQDLQPGDPEDKQFYQSNTEDNRNIQQPAETE